MIGPVRSDPEDLEHLADGLPGELQVEHLDVTQQEGIRTLRDRLSATRLDVLVANAGISDDDVTAVIDDGRFARMFFVNALRRCGSSLPCRPWWTPTGPLP